MVTKAICIESDSYQFSDKYLVVYEVLRLVDSRYPLGIKAKFVLIDIEKDHARLLVDNHYAHDSRYFHVHTGLPHNSKARETLAIQDYEKAKSFFFSEVRRIINEEQN